MIGVGFGCIAVPVIGGEPMGGYADREAGVSGTLDPLTVRVLTIHDGNSRFALIVCDVICVNEDLVNEIRALVDATICWVTATHTHASPESGCHPGGAATPKSVLERFRDAAVEAFHRALEAEEPLGAAFTRVDVNGVAGQRASSSESTSIPVDVIELVDAERRIHGVFVNLPAHPTVLPASNTLVSADLVGGVRQAIQARFVAPGEAPWVIVTTGAAGDISTRHTRPSRSPEAVAELGDRLATALDAAEGETETVWSFDGHHELLGAVGTIELSRKTRADVRLPSIADSHRDTASSDEPASRIEFTRQQGIAIARSLVLTEGPEYYRVELRALTLGSLTLVAVPAELFLRLGESIRSRLAPAVAVVIGYANGYLGYLPDEASFESPSYETFASPVAKGSGELIVDLAVEVGRRLRKPIRNGSMS